MTQKKRSPGSPDVWDEFTSAIGNVFDPNGKATTTTSTSPTTTSKTKKVKTEVKTVLTTDAPSTYTGPLSTEKTKTSKTSKTTSAKTTTTKATTTKSSTTATKTDDTTSSLPTSIAATTAASTESRLAIDTSMPTTTTLSTTASATATATSSPDTSSGTSTGAKAGIAIGVLAGVFFVFAVAFFLFRRHRKNMEARRVADDEKNGPFADSAAIGGAPKSTRLSQFFSGGAAAGSATGAAASMHDDPGFPNRRQSRGSNIALQNQAPLASHSTQGGSIWDRSTMPGNNDGSNPFGDGAERLNSGVSPVSPTGAGAALTGGVAAGTAAGVLTRKASTRKDGPNALDLTLSAPRNNFGAAPPSPAGTEYSMHSIAPGSTPTEASAGAAAIAAAGGPAVSTVHRVQLDFKPTLDDELDLRAGQLVRLLHEYDDGWALCIRLDRSKQGVVPRTCLSLRPVKPRPPPNGGRPGSAANPNGRPMTPQGGPRGPGRMGPGPMGPMGPGMGPGMGPRPQSPANRPNTPQGGRPPQAMGNQMRPQSPYSGPPGSGPRSQSPAGAPRSMSPAPGSMSPRSPIELPAIDSSSTTSRPQSPSDMGTRRVTPPGPSPMSQQMRPTNSIGRKPVPGQAM